MESNIEILENIMKPYFDKKAEIEGAPAVLEKEQEELKLKVKDLKSERIEKRKSLEKEYEELKLKVEELKNEREEKRKTLEIELENLRVRSKLYLDDFTERKEREIEEYIGASINSNPNLSVAYGSFVRKDLEKQYEEQFKNIEISFKEQEEQLIEKIEELKIENDIEINFKNQEQQLAEEIKELRVVSEDERNEKQNIENLGNKSDFSRVDLRELVEIKDDLRKQLFAERKRLNSKILDLKPQQESYEQTASELKENQLKFNQIMDRLSNFKYEYNDQNQVINSTEWRKLYEEGNLVSEKIHDLTKALSEKTSVIHELNDVNKTLEKVEEYLQLTELTNEETAAVMMSMTPWEKAEYDRRKGLLSTDDVEEINDPVISKYEKEDDNVIVQDTANLFKTIFNDIVKEIESLRAVRLNSSKEKLGENEYYISTKENNEDYKLNGMINLSDGEEVLELPCGEYFNANDVNSAVDKFYNKNEETTYIVKETGKKYELSISTVEKFKSKLKKCSTIRLLKDKKIGKLDLVRVFGKQKADKLVNEAELGTIKNTNIPEGEYIARNEAIVAVRDLVTRKAPNWLKNIVTNIKTSYQDKEEDIIDVEFDDESNIKQR